MGSTGAARSMDFSSRLERAAFVDQGGGQWTLDTGMGGGQILDESDSSAGGFGRIKAYSIRAWDSDYNLIGDTEIYSSLNAAKQAIKDKIRSTL